MLDLYERLQGPGLTNQAARKAVFRELAGQLGEVARVGEAPAPGALASSVNSGTAMRHGLLLELRWLEFFDITQGLPALTEWLASQGCRRFKYELEGSAWNRAERELEE